MLEPVAATSTVIEEMKPSEEVAGNLINYDQFASIVSNQNSM